MKGSAGDLQQYRELRVILFPSVTDQRMTVAVQATTVKSAHRRTTTIWRGVVETPGGSQSVSDALGSVIDALRDARAVL